MVMHARKLPRISDGFNEKHQTHGYENSKYSSKYRYSNHEKSRDSPSTNSLRSSSPDSRSQSPRYHHKAASYYKVREKERERDRETRERERDRDRERERDRDRERERERERDRDRDYHYRDRVDNDGHTSMVRIPSSNKDDSRSPKERRREVRDRDRDRERERDGRGNHDRINSVHKKEDKERLGRVGDWSEHVSSSGKKYYYNCRTEVSQWEKPPEWLEWERARAKDPSNRSHEKSLARQDKHSSLGESYREVRDIRDNIREERSDRDRRELYRSDDYDRRDNRKVSKGGVDDMEISSGDSTPTSEHHHNRGSGENSHEVSGANVSLASSLVSTSGTTLTSTHCSTAAPTLLQAGLRPNMGMLPTSLPTSLPPLGSSSSSCSGTNTITTSSLASSIPALAGSTPMTLPHHPRLSTLSNSMNSKSGLSLNEDNVNHSSNDEGHVGKLEPLSISANSNNIGGGGPPTPTHSENQDGIDIRRGYTSNAESQNSQHCLVSHPSSTTPALTNYWMCSKSYRCNESLVGSPTSSINSLQSLTQTAGGSLAGLRPIGPTLTPSLANYYKESLISHVQNWPAEALEKPAQRLSEEAHSIGSLVMTRVSAELKMARSLVRLAEIQATLHEQRILFLRAQKRELEDMKSQNCFMSDT